MANPIEIKLLKLELMRRLNAAKSRKDEILKIHGSELPFTMYQELMAISDRVHRMELHLCDASIMI